MNLSGTLNAFKVLLNPGLCLPHYKVSTFNDIPVPLSTAFKHGEKEVDIRAVILDKDNCFAIPHQDEIHPPYREKFQELRKAYPGFRLVIVSNTAGTRDDVGHAKAEILEKNTGVQVLRHNTKKPGCGDDIMKFLRAQKDVDITSPNEVAIIGDRLFTDIMMANMMGSYGVWIKDGIPGQKGFVRSLSVTRADANNS
jgi:phosphatidylglycerophosphatase GEP4